MGAKFIAPTVVGGRSRMRGRAPPKLEPQHTHTHTHGCGAYVHARFTVTCHMSLEHMLIEDCEHGMIREAQGRRELPGPALPGPPCSAMLALPFIRGPWKGLVQGQSPSRVPSLLCRNLSDWKAAGRCALSGCAPPSCTLTQDAFCSEHMGGEWCRGDDGTHWRPPLPPPCPLGLPVRFRPFSPQVATRSAGQGVANPTHSCLP